MFFKPHKDTDIYTDVYIPNIAIKKKLKNEFKI